MNWNYREKAHDVNPEDLPVMRWRHFFSVEDQLSPSSSNRPCDANPLEIFVQGNCSRPERRSLGPKGLAQSVSEYWWHCAGTEGLVDAIR